MPTDQVLVSKIELEELKEKSPIGVYLTMKKLEERTGKKHEWLKENILYPTKYKKILYVQNGGFVYYPQVKGEKWTFLASKMAGFLEDNFYSIFGSK
ncbi:DUF771 domain-containing protein [Psychrobacillus sp. NPDC096426]|uniref:DUF771 domain-containing protein n=1 Tax=Psychrobacillus sp. NPDC096426 TaxID=3364491 RepID=UPI00382B13BB